MSLLDKSELDDFKKIIKELEYDENNFQIEEKEDASPTNGIYTPTGIVIITCIKNGKRKEYDASGYGISWLSKFRKDLAAGYFC